MERIKITQKKSSHQKVDDGQSSLLICKIGFQPSFYLVEGKAKELYKSLDKETALMIKQQFQEKLELEQGSNFVRQSCKKIKRRKRSKDKEKCKRTTQFDSPERKLQNEEKDGDQIDEEGQSSDLEGSSFDSSANGQSSDEDHLRSLNNSYREQKNALLNQSQNTCNILSKEKNQDETLVENEDDQVQLEILNSYRSNQTDTIQNSHKGNQFNTRKPKFNFKKMFIKEISQEMFLRKKKIDKFKVKFDRICLELKKSQLDEATPRGQTTTENIQVQTLVQEVQSSFGQNSLYYQVRYASHHFQSVKIYEKFRTPQWNETFSFTIEGGASINSLAPSYQHSQTFTTTISNGISQSLVVLQSDTLVFEIYKHNSSEGDLLIDSFEIHVSENLEKLIDQNQHQMAVSSKRENGYSVVMRWRYEESAAKLQTLKKKIAFLVERYNQQRDQLQQLKDDLEKLVNFKGSSSDLHDVLINESGDSTFLSSCNRSALLNQSSLPENQTIGETSVTHSINRSTLSPHSGFNIDSSQPTSPDKRKSVMVNSKGKRLIARQSVRKSALLDSAVASRLTDPSNKMLQLGVNQNQEGGVAKRNNIARLSRHSKNDSSSGHMMTRMLDNASKIVINRPNRDFLETEPNTIKHRDRFNAANNLRYPNPHQQEEEEFNPIYEKSFINDEATTTQIQINFPSGKGQSFLVRETSPAKQDQSYTEYRSPDFQQKNQQSVFLNKSIVSEEEKSDISYTSPYSKLSKYKKQISNQKLNVSQPIINQKNTFLNSHSNLDVSGNQSYLDMSQVISPEVSPPDQNKLREANILQAPPNVGNQLRSFPTFNEHQQDQREITAQNPFNGNTNDSQVLDLKQLNQSLADSPSRDSRLPIQVQEHTFKHAFQEDGREGLFSHSNSKRQALNESTANVFNQAALSPQEESLAQNGLQLMKSDFGVDNALNQDVPLGRMTFSEQIKLQDELDKKHKEEQKRIEEEQLFSNSVIMGSGATELNMAQIQEDSDAGTAPPAQMSQVRRKNKNKMMHEFMFEEEQIPTARSQYEEQSEDVTGFVEFVETRAEALKTRPPAPEKRVMQSARGQRTEAQDEIFDHASPDGAASSQFLSLSHRQKQFSMNSPSSSQPNFQQELNLSSIERQRHSNNEEAQSSARQTTLQDGIDDIQKEIERVMKEAIGENLDVSRDIRESEVLLVNPDLPSEMQIQQEQNPIFKKGAARAKANHQFDGTQNKRYGEELNGEQDSDRVEIDSRNSLDFKDLPLRKDLSSITVEQQNTSTSREILQPTLKNLRRMELRQQRGAMHNSLASSAIDAMIQKQGLSQSQYDGNNLNHSQFADINRGSGQFNQGFASPMQQIPFGNKSQFGAAPARGYGSLSQSGSMFRFGGGMGIGQLMKSLDAGSVIGKQVLKKEIEEQKLQDSYSQYDAFSQKSGSIYSPTKPQPSFNRQTAPTSMGAAMMASSMGGAGGMFGLSNSMYANLASTQRNNTMNQSSLGFGLQNPLPVINENQRAMNQLSQGQNQRASGNQTSMSGFGFYFKRIQEGDVPSQFDENQ